VQTIAQEKMSGEVLELFRHNTWATIRLLEFCRELDPSLLDASAPGTYGQVKETLAHIVGWDEALAGAAERAAPHEAPLRFTSVDDLLERARRLPERWSRCLEAEPHPERLVEFGIGGDRRLVRAATVLTQAIHHGNHHRAQVCMVLSTVDVQPPALDAWAFSAWRGDQAERRRPRQDF
jgi:uncharacterized damage-inducible protein DinB